MTIREVSKQLFDLSLGHFFNDEKWTRDQLAHYIANMFREPEGLKLKNRIVMEICLRDGRWLFTIDRFSDEPDGFDYWIPDTREQEARLWAELTN